MINLGVGSSGRVREGDRLATVDLEPVFAAVGRTPVFRSLAPGVAGVDVA